MKRLRSAPAATPAVAALLFASGAVALVYETLWTTELGRVVGVEVHAITIGISAFFAGLALGGATLGRLADRWPRPLRLYAAMELGVSALGVLATIALAHAGYPFIRLRELAGPLSWILPFAIVSAPAFLMGGTLPALLRSLHPTGDAVASATARLYAANTGGAIAGTLATPFVLVPALGITGTAVVTAIIGLLIGLSAIAADRRGRLPSAGTDRDERSPLGASVDARLLLAIYALAGGVALGYEVVWSELLVQFLSTRSQAFAVMLATYLTGLALGSVLYARAAPNTRDPWFVFGLLLAASAGSAIGAVALLGTWLTDAQTLAGAWTLRMTGLETAEMLVRFAVASAAVLLVPTTLLGAAFPAAARIAAGAERVGRDVGAVAALNMAGGVGGSVVTGFVLVPRFGLVTTVSVLALAGATLGALAVLRSRRPRAAITGAALVIAVAAVALGTPSDRLAQLLAVKRGGTLLFYEENVAGTVAVLEQRPAGQQSTFRRLYIQGVSNSGDALTSLRYMRLQALLPLLVHPAEPRSALVVGFGTGITAGALLAYPGLERREVVELLPGVVRASPLFGGNFNAAGDSRIRLRIGDGRHELMRGGERYDLITLEPPPPSAAGVVNLYSREFYDLCRQRLAPDGLMAQWWPLPAQNDEDSRSLVRSFLDAFPFASAWSTELHEVLLIGSARSISLHGSRIAARLAEPTVAATLADVGIGSPEALLATWITDRTGLERYAGNAAPVTDDRPLIEHAAWVRRGELQRVLPRLLESATDVPLPRSDPLRDGVESKRRELFDFYRASLVYLAGREREAAPALAAVLARDPQNPYYRWVLTGTP